MRRSLAFLLLFLAAAAVGAVLRARKRSSARILDEAGDRVALPDAQVEPEATAVMERAAPVMETGARFLSIPWSPHPDPPPPETTELRLHCTLTADGMELARVDVRETDSQVFVTVLARWEPADEEPRPTPTREEGRKRQAVARLARPLGERALVHAPHDAPPR